MHVSSSHCSLLDDAKCSFYIYGLVRNTCRTVHLSSTAHLSLSSWHLGMHLLQILNTSVEEQRTSLDNSAETKKWLSTLFFQGCHDKLKQNVDTPWSVLQKSDLLSSFVIQSHRSIVIGLADVGTSLHLLICFGAASTQ